MILDARERTARVGETKGKVYKWHKKKHKKTVKNAVRVSNGLGEFQIMVKPLPLPPPLVEHRLWVSLLSF